MKTILVPVDLSAAATQVCDAACLLARLVHARLVLIHVVEPPPVLAGDLYGLDVAALGGVMTTVEHYAARRLRTLAARCAKRRVKVQTVCDTGRPVPGILAKAAALDAAYLVIGSHGHGAVYDLFAGSTTQGILRKTRCPMLVVPIKPASGRR